MKNTNLLLGFLIMLELNHHFHDNPPITAATSTADVFSKNMQHLHVLFVLLHNTNRKQEMERWLNQTPPKLSDPCCHLLAMELFNSSVSLRIEIVKAKRLDLSDL